MNLLQDDLLQQLINDPKSVFEINTSELSKQMSEQPSLYARVSYLYSVAKNFTNNCKFALDIKYSQKYRDHRSESTAEKTSDIYVKDDPEYKQIRQVYIDAEHQEQVIRSLLDGLQHRKDMLIQLGALLRQEMDCNISIMERDSKSIFEKRGGD